MAFFKFRTRGGQTNEGRNANIPAAAPAESVEAMRRRARHRLLGAAVLVLVGVVGFPLLFDTQPRPISVDIPIEIPDRAKVKPLALPSTPAPVAGGVITETPDNKELVAAAPPAAAPAAEIKPEPKPEAKPEPKPEPEARPRAEAKPEPAKPSTAEEGSRARALLEGKTAAAAKPVAAAEESGRFVVQVGAFADAAKAREVRQKLEKAGLKTYTQVAKTADGERTRVRVGPFATRGDADRAAGRIKGLSLSAAVVSL